LIRFRTAVFVFICSCVPIYTICGILAALSIEVLITELVSFILILAFVIIIICGTTYHIIKAILWARSFEEQSNTLKRARTKTIWLLGTNIVLIVFLIVYIAIVAIGSTDDETYLVSLVVTTILLLVLVFCFLMFLETYLLRYGFCKGYLLVFGGQLNSSAATMLGGTTAGESLKTATKTGSKVASAKTNIKSSTMQTTDSVSSNSNVRPESLEMTCDEQSTTTPVTTEKNGEKSDQDKSLSQKATTYGPKANDNRVTKTNGIAELSESSPGHHSETSSDEKDATTSNSRSQSTSHTMDSRRESGSRETESESD